MRGPYLAGAHRKPLQKRQPEVPRDLLCPWQLSLLCPISSASCRCSGGRSQSAASVPPAADCMAVLLCGFRVWFSTLLVWFGLELLQNRNTRHPQVQPGVVVAQQRVAIYLQPQEPLFFEALGRAVAVYDYENRLTRVAAPQVCVGGGAAQPCILVAQHGTAQHSRGTMTSRWRLWGAVRAPMQNGAWGELRPRSWVLQGVPRA
jgi:hypothetical protein